MLSPHRHQPFLLIPFLRVFEQDLIGQLKFVTLILFGVQILP